MQKQLSCFLIDNDTEDQEIFAMALQAVDEFISCIVADNGVLAIQKLQANPAYIPSLIFIDLNMPLMDGKKCLQEIKKMERLSQVPVYLYSTSADPHSIAEVKAMGAKDFIMKPAGYQQLIDLLSNILQSEKPLL